MWTSQINLTCEETKTNKFKTNSKMTTDKRMVCYQDDGMYYNVQPSTENKLQLISSLGVYLSVFLSGFL